jgi:hypothetical protein
MMAFDCQIRACAFCRMRSAGGQMMQGDAEHAAEVAVSEFAAAVGCKLCSL